MPVTTRDERLDATFAALASSTRRAILARLAEGEATVNELAGPFDLSLPAVSKHLKVLEDARLIQRGRRAQFRPCTLDPGPLDAAMSWAATCRDVWNARLDRLESHVARTTEENET
jgi:DNA-binding transcriptional ArsR family regulator